MTFHLFLRNSDIILILPYFYKMGKWGVTIGIRAGRFNRPDVVESVLRLGVDLCVLLTVFWIVEQYGRKE